jgi:hypothetical protein
MDDKRERARFEKSEYHKNEGEIGISGPKYLISVEWMDEWHKFIK